VSQDSQLLFVAQPADAGQRLDAVVARRADCSRRASVELIRAQRVRVNGAVAKPSRQLTAGDSVSVGLPPPGPPASRAKAGALRFVYDDDDLCVVDKPAGMVTHPARGNPGGTLVDALLTAVGPLPSQGGNTRAGIVHRLDKGTSGLLVVAKTEGAMSALSAAMATRRIVREYDAVVWGVPPSGEGTIEAALGRDARDRTRFAVRAQGRRALTHYRVVEKYGQPLDPGARGKGATHALLALRLGTGRTHQIRVHCLAIGNPLVGDPVYGGGKPALGMTRQALHAARLRLEHPRSGEQLSFSAPWPEDFQRLVQRLRSAQPA
jgi:23S rRNA pseudouridine1911/1915/1917 synthase